MIRRCLLLATLCLPGVQADDLQAEGLRADLQVKDGYVRGMPPGQATTAAYFSLVGAGSRDCLLVGGKSPAASRVEIHRHMHGNGVMKMRKVPNLRIPRSETVIFSPGGYHLMLFGLKKPLSAGDEIVLSLAFQNCDTLRFRLPVLSVLEEPRRDKASDGKDH